MTDQPTTYDELSKEAQIQAELNKSLNLFKRSPLAWGMFYCAEHFRSKSAPFHIKILECALTIQNLVIAAPRESSKTTILGFLYPFHCIAFKKKRFIVVITSVYSKSCGLLDAIKKEIKDNKTLEVDYGFKITKDSEGDSIIRHSDGFETRILCKGRDQIGSIRGEKFGAYRPDLILLDDIEDDEMVRNPDRRNILKNEFDQVVMLAGERKRLQVIVIGTLLHDDSQLAKLLSKDQYYEFKKLIYRGRNTLPNGKRISLWEEKWTVKELDAKEKADPITFAKEIQNDPASGLNTKFSPNDFRYWRIENMQYFLFGREGEVLSKGNLSDCKAAIACDLAWEEKRESDFSVILPAYLTPQAELLVEDYFCKKGLRPDELEEILFSMEQRLKAITGSSVYVGFEKAKLEKVMKWLLGRAMRKRNYYLCLKDLQWDMDKIQRIVTRLSPRYTQHVVFHKRGMGDLEQQLLRIPTGVHDDLADALQGVVQLLEYPKQIKTTPKQTDPFEWWRNQAIKYNKPEKSRFVFGNKRRVSLIPSKVAFR